MRSYKMMPYNKGDAKYNLNFEGFCLDWIDKRGETISSRLYACTNPRALLEYLGTDEIRALRFSEATAELWVAEQKMNGTWQARIEALAASLA